MAFNELNSVEHYIIHQLSGVNLNDQSALEPKDGYGASWVFKPSSELERNSNEIFGE
jgi:type I restriction enzyme R subunit